MWHPHQQNGPSPVLRDWMMTRTCSKLPSILDLIFMKGNCFWRGHLEHAKQVDVTSWEEEHYLWGAQKTHKKILCSKIWDRYTTVIDQIMFSVDLLLHLPVLPTRLWIPRNLKSFSYVFFCLSLNVLCMICALSLFNWIEHMPEQKMALLTYLTHTLWAGFICSVGTFLN